MSNLKINALIAVADEHVSQEICAVLKQRNTNKIVVVKSTHEAIDAMHATLFNLFIVDADIPVTLQNATLMPGGLDYIRFIRMCAGEVSEATITFIKDATKIRDFLNCKSQAVEALKAGSSCVVYPPFVAEKFDKVIAPLLSNPPKFIRTHHYTGPCRRHDLVSVERDMRKTPN